MSYDHVKYIFGVKASPVCQPHFPLDVGPCNTTLSIRSTVTTIPGSVLQVFFFNLGHIGCQSKNIFLHIIGPDSHFLYN